MARRSMQDLLKAQQAAVAEDASRPTPAAPALPSPASIPAGQTASANDSEAASLSASHIASISASEKVGRKAGRKDGGNAAARRLPRRAGRPRGPDRVPLTVRILRGTDERLTAAVEATGQSPQYLVDEALARYLDGLGV